jgi:superfamily II DNA or RNA helicase
MRIVIDHKLRIAQSDLSGELQDLIEEALTIPNIERQKQMEQGIPGWQRLPEGIELFRWDMLTKHLILPRGFQETLIEGLSTMGINYEIEDNTVFDQNPHWAFTDEIELRPWQSKAVLDIFLSRQGIWKAPAGAGKTVGILEAIRRIQCPSIVIVNTLDILNQWRERAHQFLGEDFPVELIGGGKFGISDYLTIATAHTLHSRYDDLEKTGFFDEFSFLCLDECHHATAETYNKLVGRFSARYRVGVSATPDKTGDFALATNVLGPIIIETSREEVDTLIKPKVFRIPTGFNFKYRGRIGRVPSNYPQLLESLIKDEPRNALIVATLFLNSDGHNLVCSGRLEQLNTLGVLLRKYDYPHRVDLLTGRESAEERKAIIDYASIRPCVVLSTLANEALDIPRLDGIWLVFPQRNPGLIEQQVGRIARQHHDKQYASVFDFCDEAGPLKSQWLTRRAVYNMNKYEIETVTPIEIEQALKDHFK